VSLIIQKYGGTSVGSPERIQGVAERVVRTRNAGHDVVVVVSAMGHATDELLTLAAAVSPAPDRHPRELDMLLTAGERISMALLAMAIGDRGVDAVSFTGSQAAIITDTSHTTARIQEVRADRLREEIGRNRVPIVAGFQGVSTSREVTTLGRGGSDTTAVALGAALGATVCDIFTDVDGVYTADPRKVADARRIDLIDYEEMLEMANAGAQVMHARAVELGARFEVPIRVRLSSGEDSDEGTLITRKERRMEDMMLTGIAADSGYALIVIHGLATGIEETARVLTALAEAGVSVDMVMQSEMPDRRRQLQLSVREAQLERALETLASELPRSGAGAWADERPGLSRVGLIGTGMTGRPGVYAEAYRALRDAGVEVHGVSTSSISISVLVERAREEDALRALHRAFKLHEPASAQLSPGEAT
jgi:aspartate kinase